MVCVGRMTCSLVKVSCGGSGGVGNNIHQVVGHRVQMLLILILMLILVALPHVLQNLVGLCLAPYPGGWWWGGGVPAFLKMVVASF